VSQSCKPSLQAWLVGQWVGVSVGGVVGVAVSIGDVLLPPSSLSSPSSLVASSLLLLPLLMPWLLPWLLL
jgi:hypothetical protein